jgi:excisionase family DNA binding protein
MPADGLLTTAEAEEALGVKRPQLYRWLKAGHLTSIKLPTAGRGYRLWHPEPVERLAKALPPKRPGHTRHARTALRSSS